MPERRKYRQIVAVRLLRTSISGRSYGYACSMHIIQPWERRENDIRKEEEAAVAGTAQQGAYMPYFD